MIVSGETERKKRAMKEESKQARIKQCEIKLEPFENIFYIYHVPIIN